MKFSICLLFTLLFFAIGSTPSLALEKASQIQASTGFYPYSTLSLSQNGKFLARFGSGLVGDLFFDILNLSTGEKHSFNVYSGSGWASEFGEPIGIKHTLLKMKDLVAQSTF